MADTALDLLLERLRGLIDYCETILNLPIEDEIPFLYENLEFLRTFLKDSKKKCYEHGKMKDLVTRIIDLGFEVTDEICWAIDCKSDIICYSRDFNDVIKEIESILKVVKEISNKNSYGTGVPQAELHTDGSSSRASAPNLEEETVVGFEDQANMITEELVGGSKQLAVISIHGMGGSGKTTLATKLYNDPYIVYHFYIRGWTYVSQEYRKRDLLLGILSSIVRLEEIYTMTDEELGGKLYRHLKGKRYFIVMDDLWHIKAWNYLKIFFPNECNGSRIILTSRQKEVALQAKPDGPIHFLRFLTKDESWDLLQQKVFLNETCPPDLVEIGKEIAKKCQGLPLAIVVVAGLLAKTDKTQNWWNQVAERVGSFLVSDPKQCLDTLALSYNYLPHHLKPCFLYFGAFPEDYEIPVHKLISLWIAEGFIHQFGQRRLEDVAGEYLIDLIDRSLVLVAKKGSIGRIKACRVHDLLHDLCLRKAEEENFLEKIYGYEQLAFFSSSDPIANKQHRLSIHSRFFNHLPSKLQHIRSCLCYAGPRSLSVHNTKFIYAAFKLLRVLDLSSILILVVTEAIKGLVDLRYLAIQIDRKIFLDPVFELWNLETLIVSTSKWKNSQFSFDIPDTVWKMLKLRHIHMPGTITLPNNDLYPIVLDNLQTLPLVSPSENFENVLAITPKLKKLGFCGPLISELEGYLTFPNLNFSNHLETLKLFNTTFKYDLPPVDIFHGVKFPPNLKQLTLENTWLGWKEMSILGMLSNLEVLKLRRDACIGPEWETRDGEFQKLKVLQLKYLSFTEWNTSSFHFPSLQHLVLHGCHKLEEIPSSLTDIPTLEIIELSRCSGSVVNSARQIQKSSRA
ncbi:hypothetical protein F0562_032481 [Nyssa sinensis]|uniref:Uncharacterized protein n=1 Tax=Nyssa sinensis TaxID=561372 RepID=A0A5J5AQG7_9ASTE|nr:hypothetical protein F0562_032481 [Nyssa sinensis]